MAAGHSVFNLVFTSILNYLCSLEQVEPPGTGLLFSLQTVDSFFFFFCGAGDLN